VSSYWITNPDNTYRDNVAAGSDSTGFWFALPEHPTGQFEGTDVSKATWPRGIKVREFKGNTAHSNYDSFMFDRGPNPDGTFSVAGGMHIAREDPADRNSKMVESVFEDLTAYKNRNGGIWARGEMDTFRNLKLADNAIGYTHASGLGGGDPWTSKVVDSLFVGETENIGNPRTDAEKAYGRSLPKPMMPDFPIRGYEYYDMRHDLVNTTFRNFEDNATRKTGAISYLLFASFGVSTENTVERAKFINAKPVYFPPMERKWGNDNGSGVAWRTAVIHDIDGSVSGVPGSYILINDGVNDSIAADAEVCEFKSTWNAAVCRGDIGRLNIGGVGGSALSSGAGPGGPRSGDAAAEPPVVLSRNGKDFTLTQNRSNVRAGTEIKLTTERSALSINVRELDTGSWVIFELPGFTNAASGTEQSSLDALRKASTTSYYKGDSSLWVKRVSRGFSLDAGPYSIPGAGDSLQVSR
jgi:cell migration-inducing and hyaluronan-binding protein